MKAAVFRGPHDIQVEEVDEPSIAPDDVLVQVAACGFCGSDVDTYYGRVPVGTPSGEGPLILGHELSGRIVEVGRLAARLGLAEGERVAVNPIQSCNGCGECRAGRPQFCSNLSVLGVTVDGGFAEYMRSNAAHVYPLPESIGNDDGAFVEPLAVAVNAVERAEVGPGCFAVVFGPGPIGLAVLQLLKQAGARVAVVGTRPYRLELARDLGADQTWRFGEDAELVARVQDANDGALADRVIVATGAVAASRQALAISGPGSVVVFMGVTGPEESIELPMLASIVQDKTLRFSLWYPFRWPLAISLLAQGRIDTSLLITHRVTLGDIPEAIERLVRREDGVMKTLVKL